jgi:hypothetical protein
MMSRDRWAISPAEFRMVMDVASRHMPQTCPPRLSPASIPRW